MGNVNGDHYNTEMEVLGEPDDIIFKKDKPEPEAPTNIEVAPPDTLNSGEVEMLAFMEEPVTVVVSETTDKNSPPIVQVGNNGRTVLFQRGVPVTCQRKFVDSLIAKSMSVNTPEIQNGAGERTFSIQRSSALKYPFMVIEDKNPKGPEWLRRRLAEVI